MFWKKREVTTKEWIREVTEREYALLFDPLTKTSRVRDPQPSKQLEPPTIVKVMSTESQQPKIFITRVEEVEKFASERTKQAPTRSMPTRPTPTPITKKIISKRERFWLDVKELLLIIKKELLPIAKKRLLLTTKKLWKVIKKQLKQFVNKQKKEGKTMSFWSNRNEWERMASAQPEDEQQWIMPVEEASTIELQLENRSPNEEMTFTKFFNKQRDDEEKLKKIIEKERQEALLAKKQNDQRLAEIKPQVEKEKLLLKQWFKEQSALNWEEYSNEFIKKYEVVLIEKIDKTFFANV